jgi:hypothetical protein
LVVDGGQYTTINTTQPKYKHIKRNQTANKSVNEHNKHTWVDIGEKMGSIGLVEAFGHLK